MADILVEEEDPIFCGVYEKELLFRSNQKYSKYILETLTIFDLELKKQRYLAGRNRKNFLWVRKSQKYMDQRPIDLATKQRIRGEALYHDD